jgi:type III secretion protein R
MTDPIFLIVILLCLGLAPFVALMATSFTKLVIVLSLVRNALGTQQIPPLMVINGMAMILSIYIMSPVAYEISENLDLEKLNQVNVKTVIETVSIAKEPLRRFLLKHSNEEERLFFAQSIKHLRPEKPIEYKPDDLIVLIPAFTVSEMTDAFTIGFIIYLPFIAIDIIVSNILMAMGMIMVSPMIISMPIKLVLFVMLDGWPKIVHGLILTYG